MTVLLPHRFEVDLRKVGEQTADRSLVGSEEDGGVGLDGLPLNADAEDKDALAGTEVFNLVVRFVHPPQCSMLGVDAGIGDVEGLLPHASYGEGFAYFHICWVS